MDGIIKNTYSKLTLYDLLSMLLPGILFVGEIFYLLDVPLESKTSVALIVLLGYPVGLILHSISERVWNDLFGLRNKPKHIRKTLEKIIQERNANMIQMLLCSKFQETSTKQINDNQLLDKYYEAYYYVVDVKQHGSIIRTLERQIALMRSMVIPFIFLALVTYKYYYHLETFACWFKQQYLWGCPTLYFVLLYLLAIIFFSYGAKRKQQAIYCCVFEDYEYTKRMEKYEKAE